MARLLLCGHIIAMYGLIPHLPQHPKFLAKDCNHLEGPKGACGRNIRNLAPSYVVVLLLLPLDGQVTIKHASPPNRCLVHNELMVAPGELGTIEIGTFKPAVKPTDQDIQKVVGVSGIRVMSFP